jgi:hypothetical protein
MAIPNFAWKKLGKAENFCQDFRDLPGIVQRRIPDNCLGFIRVWQLPRESRVKSPENNILKTYGKAQELRTFSTNFGQKI